MPPNMIATLALMIVLGCADRTESKNNPPELVWTDPEARGPYDVGLATLEFTDNRGKELSLDIWYPANTDAEDELAEYTPLTLSITAFREPQPAVQNAPCLHSLTALEPSLSVRIPHQASCKPWLCHCGTRSQPQHVHGYG